MALAIGTNTSFLDQTTKNRQPRTLTFSGLQTVKQLDSGEDIVVVIII